MITLLSWAYWTVAALWSMATDLAAGGDPTLLPQAPWLAPLAMIAARIADIFTS